MKVKFAQLIHPPFISAIYELTTTPPLGCKLCPLIILLSWLAKNTKQVAISLGWPGLPIGVALNWSMAYDFMVLGIRGVHTGPGHTALTRMPKGICWLWRPRVKETMAPLEEV